jgi:hypothetical protein
MSWIWWHATIEQILNCVILIDLFKLTKKNSTRCSKWSTVPKKCIWLHVCMCQIDITTFIDVMCFLLDCLHGICLLETFTNGGTTTKSIHRYGLFPMRNEELFIYYSLVLGSNYIRTYNRYDHVAISRSHWRVCVCIHSKIWSSTNGGNPKLEGHACSRNGCLTKPNL